MDRRSINRSGPICHNGWRTPSMKTQPSTSVDRLSAGAIMTFSLHQAESTAAQYAAKHQIQLGERLGFGMDGAVWKSSRNSAIKVIERNETYFRERDCYRRLLEDEVTVLAGFVVPYLIDYDNILQVVEMSIVAPPCVLDFGKAYLASHRTSPLRRSPRCGPSEKRITNLTSGRSSAKSWPRCVGMESTTSTRSRGTSAFRRKNTPEKSQPPTAKSGAKYFEKKCRPRRINACTRPSSSVYIKSVNVLSLKF